MVKALILLSIIPSVLISNQTVIPCEDNVKTPVLKCESHNSSTDDWKVTNIYSNQSFGYKVLQGKKKTGYYEGIINIDKYSPKTGYDTNISLIDIYVESWFVPGIVANSLVENGEYDSGWHQKEASVLIEFLPYGGNKGAYIEAAPQTNSFVSRTVTSSISADFKFGHTTTSGISLDGLGAESSQASSGSIQIGYSHTYTDTQPSLNAAPLQNTDKKEFEWFFSYNNDLNNPTKNSVLHIVTEYLGEFKSSGPQPSLEVFVKSSMTTHGYFESDTATSSDCVDKFFYGL